MHRCLSQGGATVSLEDFIKQDDLEVFGDLDAQKSPRTARSKQPSVQLLHIPNGTTASSLPLPNPPPPSPELPQRSFHLPRDLGTDSKTTSVPLEALKPLLRMCNLHIHTSEYSSTDMLFSHLRNLDLSREDRMRPGWDKYFMTLAGLASLR